MPVELACVTSRGTLTRRYEITVSPPATAVFQLVKGQLSVWVSGTGDVEQWINHMSEKQAFVFTRLGDCFYGLHWEDHALWSLVYVMSTCLPAYPPFVSSEHLSSTNRNLPRENGENCHSIRGTSPTLVAIEIVSGGLSVS